MKIIDLDIDEFLTGDTKIEEIALVMNPAIEVDWVYFNAQQQNFESYDDYPKAASENACKVLRWIEEHGRDEVDGMTQTGLARANQLCKGEPISEDTIARMSAFERHRQNAEISEEYKGTPWKDKGYVAWLGWGGSEGVEWAQRKLRQIREEKLSEHECGCSIGGDDEMVDGIVDLLLQVEDMENRMKMAIEVIKDFERDNILYDYDEFLERIGIGGPDLQKMIEDTMELEDLLDLGYEIVEAREIDHAEVEKEYSQSFNKQGMTEEQFYRLVSKPNEPSMLDSAFRLRRYVYAIGPQGGPDLIDTSRMFCRRMMGKRQLVWRFEDIADLSVQLNAEDNDYKIIPRPRGANVNVFLYAGGSNCRHRFVELSLDPGERVKNNKQRAERDAVISMDAPGQAGKVNDPVQYGRERNPNVLNQETTSTEFSTIDTPIGYLQGVPVYASREEAETKSQNMGCEGVYQEIEYRDKIAFTPCRRKNREGFSKVFQFGLDEEKRMIYAPAMIPNKLIRRYDEHEGEFWVRFTPDSNERAAHKYLMEARTKPEFVNLEHTDIKFDDIYLVESWIVGEDDKIYDYGFTKEQVPVGSWAVGYKVKNDEVWDEYIKGGKVKGLSVQGLFDMEFQSHKSDEYLLSEIINLIKKIN